ncbi:hypothetical protein V8E36_003163 [Tilletia maclaganii]
MKSGFIISLLLLAIVTVVAVPVSSSSQKAETSTPNEEGDISSQSPSGGETVSPSRFKKAFDLHKQRYAELTNQMFDLLKDGIPLGPEQRKELQRLHQLAQAEHQVMLNINAGVRALLRLPQVHGLELPVIKL